MKETLIDVIVLLGKIQEICASLIEIEESTCILNRIHHRRISTRDQQHDPSRVGLGKKIFKKSGSGRVALRKSIYLSV